jgi:hypothetical protein
MFDVPKSIQHYPISELEKADGRTLFSSACGDTDNRRPGRAIEREILTAHRGESV